MSDCINWTGSVNNSGYGTSSGKLAHRIAWSKANGWIPKDMVIMHTCANRLCVNPDHLELGTQHENRMEMVRRSVNPKQKITFEEAELIRWCRRQGPRIGAYGWNKRVAKAMGVSHLSIGCLVRGETFTEAH